MQLQVMNAVVMTAKVCMTEGFLDKYLGGTPSFLD